MLLMRLLPSRAAGLALAAVVSSITLLDVLSGAEACMKNCCGRAPRLLDS